MASEHATLEFMREHGLDKLVDAYGIHTYPWVDDAGTAKGADGRRSRLAKYVLDECRPEGSSNGKPCWITEWAFPNEKTSTCPLPATPHAEHQLGLVREEREAFKPYVSQRKLTGLFYYAWLDQEYGVYRCDALTDYGRAALAPF
jgi:hypothetical protein